MRGGAGLDAFLQSWDERGDLLKKMGETRHLFNIL
jgi:hypothetical protein